MDATKYTAGVDRSPTEVAALFLADEPDGDPVAFLVEALGLDAEAATEAVSWVPGYDAQPPTPADGPPKEPTKAELLERAKELGLSDVKPGWSKDQIASAIAAEADRLTAEQLAANPSADGNDGNDDGNQPTT